MSERERVKCSCCGLYGFRHGSHVIGGAAGKYHAAECRLIARVLSHQYQGLEDVARAYSGRFGVTYSAAQRQVARAIALEGGELLLDKLRALAGWLAPYQLPEEIRGRVIIRRFRLAAQIARYEDPLLGSSVDRQRRQAVAVS